MVLFVCAHFKFPPLTEITTLESKCTTLVVRSAAAILAALILFDVMQFLLLWDQLRGMLCALDRERFKRSFVTIKEFDWRILWSFTGVSFQSRRATHTALINCMEDLTCEHGFAELRAESLAISFVRLKYNLEELDEIPYATSLSDTLTFFDNLNTCGSHLATWISDRDNAGGETSISPEFEALQRGLESKGDGGRFADEVEELARLPEKTQAVERFLCLMYIGFIQTVIARLHTLLVSIASVFSLMALGVAIYPFVPFSPLLILGGGFLALIAWAFFRVFSQMDTDPILSRIVNGDDRKLQGNFYLKFAEAMALPLLTAGSSLLPGGASRLLELAQALIPHGK
jgi:hypothetical protein